MNSIKETLSWVTTDILDRTESISTAIADDADLRLELEHYRGKPEKIHKLPGFVTTYYYQDGFHTWEFNRKPKRNWRLLELAGIIAHIFCNWRY